jgi:peptide deformylase
MKYALRFAGARVLRSEARAVRADEREALAPLLRAMERLVVKEKAQGLGAPQVGAGLRLFLLAADRDRPASVVINPQILRRSRSRYVDWEACLSVPDHAALVSRPSRISVTYETLDGEEVQRTLSGNDARVFQHEVDHLDGVLYTSRMIASSLTHVAVLRDPQAKAEIERSVAEKLSAARLTTQA